MSRQSDERDRTYRRVVDLTRAGLTVQDAARALAEELAATPGAITQRYYIAARELGKRAPRTTAPRQAPTRRKAATNPLEVDAAHLLETAAAMIREAAKVIADLERDATRWRAVRDALGDL